MSNNTARLAREWAQFELDNAGEFSDKGRVAAAEHIMATTTPLTMADVEWDDDKHYLAGATGPFGDEVVMMWYDDGTDHIFTNGEEWPRDRLTPNGKRYELREVTDTPDAPTHPATLTALEDYEDAPEGTIVARDDHAPLLKRGPNAWTTEYSSLAYDEDMAGTERQVLRKGWGK